MRKTAANASANAMAGPLLMLGSALMYTGLTAVIKILGSPFGIWDITIFRFGLGMVALMILSIRRGNPFKGHNQPLLVARGVAGSITFLCLVVAIRLIPISTAMSLFYSFPAFTALFAVMIFGERMTWSEALCIAATFGGVTILFDFRFEGGLLGQIMGVLGGAFAGFTICLIKQLRSRNGTVTIYLYFCLLGTIISLPGFLADPHLPVTGLEWLFVAGVLITSTTAQLMMTQGFLYCKSWEGGLYMTSELIFTAMLGIFLLGEPFTMRLFLGGLLILASIIALNLLTVRRAARSVKGR